MGELEWALSAEWLMGKGSSNTWKKGSIVTTMLCESSPRACRKRVNLQSQDVRGNVEHTVGFVQHYSPCPIPRLDREVSRVLRLSNPWPKNCSVAVNLAANLTLWIHIRAVRTISTIVRRSCSNISPSYHTPRSSWINQSTPDHASRTARYADQPHGPDVRCQRWCTRRAASRWGRCSAKRCW